MLARASRHLLTMVYVAGVGSQRSYARPAVGNGEGTLYAEGWYSARFDGHAAAVRKVMGT